MARLKSELEVTCPCCNSTLVIDLNLGRVVSHAEPERGNKPELSDAQRIIAEEAARREAIFQQSVDGRKREATPCRSDLKKRSSRRTRSLSRNPPETSIWIDRRPIRGHENTKTRRS